VNIEAKLSCVSYDIFKSKLYSHDIISKLDAIKQELEKLNEIVKLNEFSLDELNSTHANELNGLKNDLMKRLTEIETLVNSFPKNNDTQRIIDLLNKLKQSNLDRLLQKSSNISSIISLIGMFVLQFNFYLQVLCSLRDLE